MRALAVFLGLSALFLGIFAWAELAEIQALRQQRDRALQACEAGE